MKLVKTNENWRRTFDMEGVETGSTLESAQFDIKDDAGNAIGNAYVNQGNASVNVNIYNFGTVEEGIEKLKKLLGVTEY